MAEQRKNKKGKGPQPLIIAVMVVFGAAISVSLWGGGNPIASFFLYGLPVALLGLVGIVLWQLPGNMKQQKANLDADTLLKSGDLEGAAKHYTDSLSDLADNQTDALAVSQLARLQMSRLQLSEARDLFKHSLQKPAGDVRAQIQIDYAECLALLGDLREAEDVLHNAEAELSHAQRGLVLAVEAVLELRQGRTDYVVKRTAEEWKSAEAVLFPASMRRLRLLRAFALNLADKARHGEEIAELIGGARPFRPGEYDYLGLNWPEFRGFLFQNGCASTDDPTLLKPGPLLNCLDDLPKPVSAAAAKNNLNSEGERSVNGVVGRSKPLFIVLLVLLVGIVLAMGIKRAGRAPVYPPEMNASADEAAPFEWTQLLRWLPWATVVGACGVFYFRWLRPEVVTAKENLVAIAMLNSGDLEGAARQWDGLLAIARNGSLVHAMYLNNRAAVCLLQAQFGRAREMLQAARKACSPAGFTWQLYEFTTINLANACMLSGDLAAGENVLREAESLVSNPRRGRLLFAESILALRRGAHTPALTRMKDDWFAAEGTDSVIDMRRLRLLRAMALSRVDAAAHAEEIRSLLVGARPCRPGEYDYIGAQWPEFKDFLAQSGFAPAIRG